MVTSSALRSTALFAVLGMPLGAHIAGAEQARDDLSGRLIDAVVPTDADRQFDTCFAKALGPKGEGSLQNKHIACATHYQDANALEVQFVRAAKPDVPAAAVTLKYSRAEDRFTIVVSEQRGRDEWNTQTLDLPSNEPLDTPALKRLVPVVRAMRNDARYLPPL